MKSIVQKMNPKILIVTADETPKNITNFQGKIGLHERSYRVRWIVLPIEFCMEGRQ